MVVGIVLTSKNGNWPKLGHVLSPRGYPVFLYEPNLGITYMFATPGLHSVNYQPSKDTQRKSVRNRLV